jgi:hypothetical protein
LIIHLSHFPGCTYWTTPAVTNPQQKLWRSSGLVSKGCNTERNILKLTRTLQERLQTVHNNTTEALGVGRRKLKVKYINVLNRWYFWGLMILFF